MNEKEEKLAVFWCDLLGPVIYSEIEKEAVHQYLKEQASREVVFPDGQCKKPSLTTLKRKLQKFKKDGYYGLFRKTRKDYGKARTVSDEVISRAIDLKKEQPLRSHRTINHLLQEQFGVTIPKSTLYRHLKQAGATRMKLGIIKKKVRGRWTRKFTHDLWEGDFAHGPYVAEGDDIVPTYLAALIDCHSRYVVEARYYFRQNMDVLIDSLLRAVSKHGAPFNLYFDNAKVYQSHGLKAACHIMQTRLFHRPPGEPEPGGLVERFIQTAQNQFEAEVKACDILSLEKMNQAFSAWLSVGYHNTRHSEIAMSPEKKMKAGLRGIKHVDMKKIIAAFMQKVHRTVHRTFSDVRLNNRYYKVDPKLRGERVQVAFDPFSNLDAVEIYSLHGHHLCSGERHFREPNRTPHHRSEIQEKPKYSYIDSLERKHRKYLEEKTKGIDYRNISQKRLWPFHEFAKTIAQFLGNKGGLSSFNADQLESLKKVYDQSLLIDKHMVKKAFENADKKTFPYIIHELKQLLKQKEETQCS